MPVSIKGTGGGGVTLDAGAAASATTLTLPNVSGTVLQSGTAVTVAQGGTGLTTMTAANNALYSTSSSAVTAGTLPVAAGGTGAATLTTNNVLLGNGTSAIQFVAPGTSGNVLTSNGTTWQSTAPASSGGGQLQVAVFSTSTTWTCPAGVTKVLVTCVGGGSGGIYVSYGCTVYAYGGSGGLCVALVTVVPATVYTITIGSGGAGTSTSSSGTITGTTGGTTSFGSLVTATGGGAATANGGTPSATNGALGAGSTTGTLLRNSNSGNPRFGYTMLNPAVQILGGAEPVIVSAAQTWSTSSPYQAGAGGIAGGASIGFGGTSGAVLIQYVG